MDNRKKGGGPYLIFFGLICALFIGILGFASRLTRQANPIMLDEHGKVVSGH